MSLNLPFYVKLYVATVPIFFAIDMVWLGFVAKNFYRKQLGFLLADSVNWTAALLFYFAFIAGILLFAVVPGLEARSLGKAALLGALFGFFTYATYDLTNMATVKGWPLVVVLVDIPWGMALCGLVASASYLIGTMLR